MGKKEYLEFLLPLLKDIRSKEVSDKNIGEVEIYELGKDFNGIETKQYIETVKNNSKELLKASDISKELRRIFVILVVLNGYLVLHFSGEENESKFFGI